MLFPRPPPSNRFRGTYSLLDALPQRLPRPAQQHTHCPRRELHLLRHGRRVQALGITQLNGLLRPAVELPDAALQRLTKWISLDREPLIAERDLVDDFVVEHVPIGRPLTSEIEHLVLGHADRPRRERPLRIVLIEFANQRHGHALQDVLGLLEIRNQRANKRRQRRLGAYPEHRELFCLCRIHSKPSPSIVLRKRTELSPQLSIKHSYPW